MGGMGLDLSVCLPLRIIFSRGWSRPHAIHWTAGPSSPVPPNIEVILKVNQERH